MVAIIFICAVSLLFFLLYLLIAIILSHFDILLWPFEDDAKEYPKLSYKQFIDYYWVNPDKWILCDNYVRYKYIPQPDTYCSQLKVCSKSFSFSLIDQFKYRKFKHNIETNKAKIRQSKAHNEAYQILLNGVQEDINKLRQQSENELSQAMENMKEVKKRIN